MFKYLFVSVQYLLPQHLLTKFTGFLAENTTPWFKNLLIWLFLKRYAVNLQEAKKEDPYAYLSFNDFFTRKLKANARPIDPAPQHIISPVDGMTVNAGRIVNNQLIQAKNRHFKLIDLLGGDEKLAAPFNNGLCTTLYLAPKDYHRVHMPLNGELRKTIFIPGSLFSVNRMTAELVPSLFSRNERLVCVFETEVGTAIVILVGAMIVGSIKTVWMPQPYESKKIHVQYFADHTVRLSKGDELGYFKVGSTVILLFQPSQISWLKTFIPDQKILLGQAIAATN